jgi:CRP-like cAMP-binding protein
MISPEVLRRFSYFSGISESMVKQVAMICEDRTARAGETLFEEGREARFLYVIVEGEIDIRYVLGDGSHQTVDTLVAGDLMMWSSLVEPHQTHSTAVARTSVRLVEINAVKLRDLMASDPLLGYRIMNGVAEAMSQRLHGARLQIAAM